MRTAGKQHGLNEPLFPISFNSEVPLVHFGNSQYGDWLTDIILHQDLGQSLAEGGAQVSTELGRRLPITVELMIVTIIFALLLGIIPGWSPRSGRIRRWIGPTRLVSVLWLSIPIVLSGDPDDHFRPLVVRLDAAAIWDRLRADL